MAEYTLLGLCGSLRGGSANRKLLRQAVAIFDPASFHEGNLRLPLYDGDLEDASGIPPEVQALADQIRAADAVLIATPEYNKSVPGVLKNALDWVSRTKGSPWKDKPVAILSAADGRAGGDRSQFALRLCLTPFRPRLITGPEVMIAHAEAAFDENGHLTEPRYVKALTELMAVLRQEVRRSGV